MQIEVAVSFPLAFLAGVLSFLSPCILPVVPSYVAFVSGVTLEALGDAEARVARKRAALHAALFGVGFGIVFMTLGAAATTAGRAFAQSLPWITRVGGVAVVLFGLYLLGLVRLPALSREVRVHLTERPTGPFGSLLVGVAFGAGWTPCVGPVLASILLYAGLEHTVVQGTLLLGAYGLGLAVPFVGVAVGFNWFLAGARGIRPWLPHVERVAGGLLLLIGLMMVTGRFTALNATLAGLGQLIDLEIR